MTDPHAEASKVLCATCPYNQFGSSDTGKGKKCADRIYMYMYIPELAAKYGEDGYFLINIATTSIKKVATFFRDLKYNTPSIDYRTVRTVLNFAPVEGKTYCEVTSVDAEPIAPNEIPQVVESLRLRKENWAKIGPGLPPTFPTNASSSQASTL